METGKKVETLEIEATDITSLKNPSRFFMVTIDNNLYLVDYNDLLKNN